MEAELFDADEDFVDTAFFVGFQFAEALLFDGLALANPAAERVGNAAAAGRDAAFEAGVALGKIVAKEVVVGILFLGAQQLLAGAEVQVNREQNQRQPGWDESEIGWFIQIQIHCHEAERKGDDHAGAADGADGGAIAHDGPEQAAQSAAAIERGRGNQVDEEEEPVEPEQHFDGDDQEGAAEHVRRVVRMEQDVTEADAGGHEVRAACNHPDQVGQGAGHGGGDFVMRLADQV